MNERVTHFIKQWSQ